MKQRRDTGFFVDLLLLVQLALLWNGGSGGQGRLDLNVARGRPGWQVSVYYTASIPQYHSSDLAVDGNRDPNLFHGSCMVTQAHQNPWWAVDLGLPTHVRGVNLVNRGEASFIAVRENNFIVGLTNISVLIVPPTPFNYSLCGRYPGAVGIGESVYLECNANSPPARYLIVQTIPIAPPDYLNFCELEVYVRRIPWSSVAGVRMVGRTVLNATVDHTLFCMNACTSSVDCDSFNFRSVDNKCQLNKHGNNSLFVSRTGDFVNDTDWTWWID